MRCKRREWTEEEDKQLIANYKHMSNQELAELLDRPLGSVKGRKRRIGIVKWHRGNTIYEIYKGYELVAKGTARECAKKLGVNIDTIYGYNTPSRLARLKDLDNATIALKVEDS